MFRFNIRESSTIKIMIQMYCRDNHGSTQGLCEGCAELLEYAEERLKRCPMGDNKPVCSACTIHCYRPDMRDRIKKVMRYSGPRLMKRHPVTGIMYLLKKKFYRPSE